MLYILSKIIWILLFSFCVNIYCGFGQFISEVNIPYFRNDILSVVTNVDFNANNNPAGGAAKYYTFVPYDKVDYRNVYQLRFNTKKFNPKPTDNRSYLQEEILNNATDNIFEETTNHLNFLPETIKAPETTATQLIFETEVEESIPTNLTNNYKNNSNTLTQLVGTETNSSNYKNYNKINKTKTESNIMRPSSYRPNPTQNVISLITNRLKYLLFGSNVGDLVKPTDLGRGFLNLINIIKFNNVPCTGTLKPFRLLSGTCYHKYECEGFGGVPMGPCAGGYGVCCVFKYGCGATTKKDVSYWESFKFPLPLTDSLACILSIDLLNGVKQVRLDFLFFEVKAPTNGNCIDDQFVVSGHTSNFYIPTLCGINSGQHIYIDVEKTKENRIFLSLIGRTIAARAFSIRITQLRINTAPQGCLQYYQGLTGFIKSFNYDNVSNIVQIRNPTYFNDLNYAICIKRGFDMCNITYTNEVQGKELQFDLKNVDAGRMSLVPAGQAGAEIFQCPDDYIVLNGLRLCGEKLNDARLKDDFTMNAAVSDITNGPFIIPFRTNNNTVGRGFNLFFNQNKCP